MDRRPASTAASIARGNDMPLCTMSGLASDPTRLGRPIGTLRSSWSTCMRWLQTTLLGWARQTPPRLSCKRRIWTAGTTELAKRTLGGRRESGAFLLGRKLPDGSQEILSFVYYDDIHPHALDNGAVVI